MNEIMSIAQNTLTRYAEFNEALLDVAQTLDSGLNAEKERAEKYAKLRDTENRDKAFIEMGYFTEVEKSGVVEKKPPEFKVFIDNWTNGRYSGNTAYKYAQCFDLFHGLPEWDSLNMGKMIILSPILNKKNVDNYGMSLDGLYFNIGADFYRPTKDAHDEWRTANEKVLSTVEFLRNSGAPNDMIQAQMSLIPPEPVIMGFMMDDSTGELVYDVSMCEDKGRELVPEMTDKQLKAYVKQYFEMKKPKKSDSKEDDSADSVKTIAELKADALSALLAYMNALDCDAPDYMLDTADYLKEVDEK